MIIESISNKPKAISTFMTLEEFIVGLGQGHFMGLVRLEKASNGARLRFSDYDYSKKYKNILVKTLCSIYAQEYSKMAVISSINSLS